MAVDINLWRERIRFSRGIMEAKGILGDGGQDGTMRELIKLYASDPDSHLPLGDWFNEEQRVFSNKIFSTANQLESEVAAQRPEIYAMPRSGISSVDAARRAMSAGRIAEPLVNYDIDELGMADEANDCLLDHFVAPVAWARAGFTPQEEVFKPQSEESAERQKKIIQHRFERPDRSWIQRVAPWDVVPDPNARRFTPNGGMKWVAFRSIVPLEDLKANPGTVNFSELDELAGNVTHPLEHLRRLENRDQNANPDAPKFVEIYTVYETVEETWFQLTLDGPDKLIRKQDDWPIPWEWLPVRSFIVNKQRDTPWGVPLLKPLIPLQREINTLRTMISWITRNTRRLILAHKDMLAPGEESKIEFSKLVEVLYTTGAPREAIEQVSIGGFPQELFMYAQMLDEDSREMLGLSRMGRGQRINVETATEAGDVQSGQDINVDRVAIRYESFWQDILSLHIQGRRSTFTTNQKEVVPLLGQVDADGLQVWATVDKETLRGDFDFKVIPRSTRRRDRQQEEAFWMARLQVAIENPQIFNVAYYAGRLAAVQGVPPEKAMQIFAQTASAAQGIAGVRDTVNPETDTPAPNGQGLQLALAAARGQS